MRDRLERLGAAALRGLRHVMAFVLLVAGFVLGLLAEGVDRLAELVRP